MSGGKIACSKFKKADCLTKSPDCIWENSKCKASEPTKPKVEKISGKKKMGCSKHKKADCVSPCTWSKGKCTSMEVTTNDRGEVVIKKKEKQRELPLSPTCDTTIFGLRSKQDSVMLQLTRLIKQSSFGCAKLASHHQHTSGECISHI
jgi:hypothetical protein